MEETIKSNQMDLEKEEALTETDVAGTPPERHILRMPDFLLIHQGLDKQPLKQNMNLKLFQGLNHFQVAAIEICQSQYKKLAQRSQGGRVGNIPKPLAWGYELLHFKSFLSQEKTLELLGGLSKFYCKKMVKKIKNWLKNQSLLSEDQKKELEITPAMEMEGSVASTS
ncbi:hypothetical protein O181_106113 [Austropuccinia psidii MF-1]|uniref:Uncharacterized protein n=1 Tax=Austropuccinia psidii MF-1 TaxID=1389203 RepID=A0A9Q3JQ76_9BASI|nr:hypothetical protein [Austropuccinia psidii MF-1]